MNKIIPFLVISAFVIGCRSQPESFEFTIRGTVVGQDSGQFYISESRRAGDEIPIPYRNHQFEYKGTSPNIYSSMIYFNHKLNRSILPLVIEPGEIILKIHTDSLFKKSKVIAGPYNLNSLKACRELNGIYAKFGYNSEESNEKLMDWIRDNSENNYTTIKLLYQHVENEHDYIPLELVEEVLDETKDEKLKQSREYIKLYSIWLSKKDSINRVGKKAADFTLRDIKEEEVRFNSVAENKITFVERSGSWCENSTRLSGELIPIYEKYSEKGFEIITIVQELKTDRWKKWIEKENFPWTNLIELEADIAKEQISYADMLFIGDENANYLVDAYGEVIATNISIEKLNEMLMENFEPQAYQEYLKNKWDLPKGIYILDKEKAINSFEELTQKLPGKPFFMNFWGMCCHYSTDQFEYNDQLETFLKSKDIEMVYVNMDVTIDESAWLNSIRKYNLKGHHLRNNYILIKDLEIIGLGGILPTYMIVDSNGNVIVEDALRPSQKEDLYKQIESVL